MKTCTFVICFLLSAIASFATAPASGKAANPVPFTVCLEAENSNGDGPLSSDPNASNGVTRGGQNGPEYFVEYVTNVPSTVRYKVTLRYYAERNSLVNVSVNGGKPFQVELPASHSWNIVSTEHTFEVNLIGSTNRIRIQELPGYDVRQDKVCWTEIPGTEWPISCDFSVNPWAVGNPASYLPGQTVTLDSRCSGADCDAASQAWIGDDIIIPGPVASFPAPSTPGDYIYRLIATRYGCAKDTTVNVTIRVQNASAECDFQIAPTSAASTYEVGATIGFSANCSGGDCDEVQFIWSGNGILREGRNIGVEAPATPGTYIYDLMATKPGCGGKTASVTVQVIIPPGCDYDVSAAVSNATPACSEPITLSSQCTGPDCAGITYGWSGGGLNVSGSSVTVPAPSVSGTYNYFVFANKEGCRGKSSGVVVTVSCESNPTEPFSACVEAENSNSDGEVTDDPNASNGKTRGTQNGPSYFVEYQVNGVKVTGLHQVTLRYYSTQPTGITISVNGEETAPLTGLAASGSWNIVWAEKTYNFNLKEGNNKIRIWSGFGYPVIRQDKICVTGPGGTGNPPSCDFNITTGVSTTTPACSTTVSAGAGCSGFDCQSVSYQWSGNGTNSSFSYATILPPRANGTYTYTLTASKNGCASVVKTIDITVNGCEPSGPFSACAEAEWSGSNGPTSSDPNASNGQTRGAQNNYDYYVDYYIADVPAAGVYPVTLRYYAEANAQVSVSVNGNAAIGSAQLPASNSWNIVAREEIINVPLSAGNNTIRIQGLPGAACRQDKICVGNILSNARMAVPELNALQNDTPLLQAYPNPAPGEFKASFHLKTGEAATIRVTDVQGKVWHTRNVSGKGPHEERITLGNAPAGIYLLQVKKPDSVETKKILLTH
ncbi:Por secretion system C-terminal sorting domain-containing protein [Dyadobacter sp. SG02]|uniref:T9SS type A sorting domain-containing protein n=1 Tax=Dyadobacter sp. SG02 TaxID=1855291 RepID=UPI0008CF4988|nr:T9SS type A sorting domain-containing protein [Dyadobacter sp. SG02]SEI98119.1 Por secretion system C-terminal sorting domain-containing protein [Dyadobacter sp. SG02]